MRIYALLLILVLLAACAPIEPTKPGAPASPKEEPAPAPAPTPQPPAQPAPEPAPAPAPAPTPAPQPAVTSPAPAVTAPPAEETPSADLDPGVQALVDKALKVKSLAYMYVKPDETAYGSKYFIKGTKQRIELRQPYEIRDRENYFDILYLDNTTAYGIGICSGLHGLKDCPQLGKVFSVRAASYYAKTPFDWLSLLNPTAMVRGVEQFTNRAVNRIEFDQADGTHVQFLMDDFYGLPIKITFYDADMYPKEVHQYKDFVANHLRDSDVLPAKNISTANATVIG